MAGVNGGHAVPYEDTHSGRVAFLREVAPFATLSDEALAVIVKDFQLLFYKRGEIIFGQGDRTNDIYVIATGKIRVYKVSPSGIETSINIFFPTDIVGEFAAIDSKPRSAAAKAVGRCGLLVMSQTKLLDHMRAFPDIAIEMNKLLTAKLRWTATYAETVAQYDAAGRLLHTILLYNELYGQEEVPGKRYRLNLALNQADLASLIGARREWVNRLLKDWRERGLLEYRGRQIIILDLPRVEQERNSLLESRGTKW